ncbi:hypothetical protein G6011_02078 [Alternaria panax]|uniref:ATPase dynein-related AAA domain-containing protein n=1 Tax=Alternaria panax TaxID=48097 RepID=A0AAD4FDR6_9PLEO|nr:hypothetical protein G6011_02078 [Alternaria panax]
MPQHVLNQLESDQIKPAPPVMVFTVSPGQGKTEVAEQLGALLCVRAVSISCSHMQTDTELFGPIQGYEHPSDGSLLNNHLSDNSGKCSMVFLDKSNQTSPEVRKALLTTLEGKHEDRRYNRDEAVKTYYEQHLKQLTDEQKQDADLEPLLDKLDDLFHRQWVNAFASHIHMVFPFFPFSFGEQATVTYKLLLHDAAMVRKYIDVHKEVKQHMGHCHISFPDDSKLCSHIAKKGYNEDSGAWGLKHQAKSVAISARQIYNRTTG